MLVATVTGVATPERGAAVTGGGAAAGDRAGEPAGQDEAEERRRGRQGGRGRAKDRQVQGMRDVMQRPSIREGWLGLVRCQS